MSPNEYQQEAARTLIEKPDAQYTDSEMMLLWNAIGLGGEAGEVLEIVKKGVFHRHGVDDTRLRKECGDCLWYIAAILSKKGWKLEDVMLENIAKLKARYPEGYSSERSINRVE